MRGLELFFVAFVLAVMVAGSVASMLIDQLGAVQATLAAAGIH